MKRAPIGFLLLLVLSACEQDAPTTVLLRIESGTVTEQPERLALTVLAAEGLLLERRVPAQGAPTLPGEVVLYPDREGGELRLWVRAFALDTELGSGVTRVTLVRQQQTPATVTLAATPLPDRDGDGVPDEIDNCPDWPNPEQEPCPTEGGPGDASDGGQPDLRHDAAPDGPKPDLRNCDEDDDGHRAVACGGPDCDDKDPNIHPGAKEDPPGGPLCKDGKDNNCNGLTDLEDPGCRACSDASECNDNNACTVDACTAGLCVNTPATNKSCTDADACTTNTTCQADGSCGGGSPTSCPPPSNECKLAVCVSPTGCATQNAPNGKSCDDGDPCTVSTCQAGTCTAANTNYCYVENQCYSAGSSANGCVCDPSRSKTALLPPVGGCQVGNTCVAEGTADANGCQCTQGSFDPPAGGCRIGGVCYPQGQVEPLGKCVCQGAVDPTDWSPLPSDCKIDGVCLPGGTVNGPCLSCVPSSSQTAWSGPCAGAIIISGVNIAHDGDLGGTSGADALCATDAAAAGVRNPTDVRAFLAASGRPISTLVPAGLQSRPVVAIGGQQLFTSWTAMLGGASPPTNTIETWNGTLVNEGPQPWDDADAWTGSTTTGQPSGTDCSGWTSAAPGNTGTVHEVDMSAILTIPEIKGCSLQHAVLCVWAP